MTLILRIWLRYIKPLNKFINNIIVIIIIIIIIIIIVIESLLPLFEVFF